MIEDVFISILLYICMLPFYHFIAALAMEYYVCRYQSNREELDDFFASLKQPLQGAFAHEEWSVFKARSKLLPVDYLLKQAQQKKCKRTWQYWFRNIPIWIFISFLIWSISTSFRHNPIEAVIVGISLIIHIYTLVRALHFGHKLKSPM